MLIYMADGRRLGGGFSDRLRGILSCYKFSKENGFDFRINFTHPFDIQHFLLPNLHDWRVTEGQLSYDPSVANVFVCENEPGVLPEKEREEKWVENYFRKHLTPQPGKQWHVYTNSTLPGLDEKGCFNELFKLKPDLQSSVDQMVNTINRDGNYLSVATRFRNLLGDFRDTFFPLRELDTDEKRQLISACKSKIAEIWEEYHMPILVTSDSRSFLDALGDLNYVHTIPGKIAHLDTGNPDIEAHMKTLVDFFTISKAQRSYMLVGPGMYNGQFALRASRIDGHPYEVLHVDCPEVEEGLKEYTHARQLPLWLQPSAIKVKLQLIWKGLVS